MESNNFSSIPWLLKYDFRSIGWPANLITMYEASPTHHFAQDYGILNASCIPKP